MDKMDLKEVLTPYEGAFNTYTGIRMDFMNPKPSMIHPRDISQGLGNTCRFSGQINNFYSVAQHSVLVMLLAPASLKRAALLHDAAEAYLGDVITPLKYQLREIYVPLEAKMQEAIFARFAEPIENLNLLKEYDAQAYEMEKKWYKKGQSTEWVSFWKQYDVDVMNWPPNYACMRFWVELERAFSREVLNG